MNTYRENSEKKMAKLRERLSDAEEKRASVRREWDDFTDGIKALYRANGNKRPDRDLLTALIRKITISHNGDFTIEWNFDRESFRTDGKYMRGAKKA